MDQARGTEEAAPAINQVEDEGGLDEGRAKRLHPKLKRLCVE